jgi:hypothetical protein
MDDASKVSQAEAPGRLPVLTLRASDVLVYRACDNFSGGLIFPMLVFSPWAFGTTQPWAVWVMNFAGYVLGGLLLVKLFIRAAKGYPAMRWGGSSSRHFGSRSRTARRLTVVLAVLTLLILAYCLVAALNAAATYRLETRLFEYHGYWRWLPHSFDSQRSWFVFWMYLGLAGSFWSVWDWLLGLSGAEERAARQAPEPGAGGAGRLPDRLRWLLWGLCLNGALLGLEGIIQRASGADKLLFLVKPRVNEWGETQFASYSYRSNAAQYFNLLWPLCLGFWWTLQRAGGRRGGHHLLLAGAVIMAACPIISSSRGGAFVAVGLMVLSVGYLLFINWAAPVGRRPWVTAVLLGVFLAGAIGVGGYFGWEMLSQRLENVSAGYEGREAMFNDARPMAENYPVYGTGPGTFATVFQLYRISNATYWPEQLHNDWLETRITFGWAGMALILAALWCVGLRRFVRGGIRSGRRLGTLAWLALAGCLVHAVYDFPLQVHSILFLFLVLCAILFSLGGRAAGQSGAK